MASDLSRPGAVERDIEQVLLLESSVFCCFDENVGRV